MTEKDKQEAERLMPAIQELIRLLSQSNAHKPYYATSHGKPTL